MATYNLKPSEQISSVTMRSLHTGLKFEPPVYLQRYAAVYYILTNVNLRGQLRKVVDFGCAELSLFPYLKNLKGIQEILFIDVDMETLRLYKSKITPLITDHLCLRKEPLHVEVLEGSIANPYLKLLDVDVVICLELIEHLYPDALDALPHNVFQFIEPLIAIFTTPNADFNVLFPNFSGMRHDDHKFEWSRQQFEDWALNLVERYPKYSVSFDGIGLAPEGSEQFGCCTQMAIFVRKDSNVEIRKALKSAFDNDTKNCTFCVLDHNEFTDFYSKGVCSYESNHNFLSKNSSQCKHTDLYKVVRSEDYPYEIDNRTQEKKALDYAENRIYTLSNRIRWSNECDGIDTNRIEIPISGLISNCEELSITELDLRNMLEQAGWNIEECELDGARTPCVIYLIERTPSSSSQSDLSEEKSLEIAVNASECWETEEQWGNNEAEKPINQDQIFGVSPPITETNKIKEADLSWDCWDKGWFTEGDNVESKIPVDQGRTFGVSTPTTTETSKTKEAKLSPKSGRLMPVCNNNVSSKLWWCNKDWSSKGDIIKSKIQVDKDQTSVMSAPTETSETKEAKSSRKSGRLMPVCNSNASSDLSWCNKSWSSIKSKIPVDKGLTSRVSTPTTKTSKTKEAKLSLKSGRLMPVCNSNVSSNLSWCNKDWLSKGGSIKSKIQVDKSQTSKVSTPTTETSDRKEVKLSRKSGRLMPVVNSNVSSDYSWLNYNINSKIPVDKGLTSRVSTLTTTKTTKTKEAKLSRKSGRLMPVCNSNVSSDLSWCNKGWSSKGGSIKSKIQVDKDQTSVVSTETSKTKEAKSSRKSDRLMPVCNSNASLDLSWCNKGWSSKSDNIKSKLPVDKGQTSGVSTPTTTKTNETKEAKLSRKSGRLMPVCNSNVSSDLSWCNKGWSSIKSKIPVDKGQTFGVSTPTTTETSETKEAKLSRKSRRLMPVCNSNLSTKSNNIKSKIPINQDDTFRMSTKANATKGAKLPCKSHNLMPKPNVKLQRDLSNDYLEKNWSVEGDNIKLLKPDVLDQNFALPKPAPKKPKKKRKKREVKKKSGYPIPPPSNANSP